MPYTNLVDRLNPHVPLGGNVGALIPEEVSDEIIKGTYEKSAALKLFRHRDMGRAQQRIPVMGALPTAYFVTAPTAGGEGANWSSDTGWKQTTEMGWNNVWLNAEELAAIVPIPEKVLDDSSHDLWGEIKPAVEEAIAIALDDAIFFGTNKPTTWPTAIAAASTLVGNTVTAGSGVDYMDDINSAMAAVEADGFFPNGFFARMQSRAKLRGLRDAQRNFLMNPDAPSNLRNMPIQIGTLFGEDIIFSRAGFTAFNTLAAGGTAYTMITGDFKQAIIGVRQDITVKMLDQAVITDATGAVIFNLPQQDMVAMRVVARFAFAVPNPINRQNPSLNAQAVTPNVAPVLAATNRYPFSAILQKQTTPWGEG